MNEIKFKLSRDQIYDMKRYSQIMNSTSPHTSCTDMLIKTNKDKNIIIVLCNLKFKPIKWQDGTIQDQDHSSTLTLEEKSDEDFMFYAERELIRINSMTLKREIMPVAVPPIEDYECKIFESSCLPATRSGVYLLQMYGRSFFYTFQVKPIGKMLQIRKDTTTINQYA